MIRVFSRSVEASYEKGLDSPLSGTRITARLVIPPHHMGCLLGRGGSIMADMRKVTGAYIKIVGGNEVPRCSLGTDQVVLVRSLSFISDGGNFHQVTLNRLTRVMFYLLRVKGKNICSKGNESNGSNMLKVSQIVIF